MELQFYNSLSKTEERFKPLSQQSVSFYSCGPTVYWYPSIGNYKSYIAWDVLKKTLKFLGYKVNHVMNITDVGHLTDDDLLSSDTGEDKMEKAAKRENKTVWDVARYYEDDFLKGLEKLHIESPTTVCRATDHIPEMIHMIEALLVKGHAYQTATGIYYDIASFPQYGELSGNKLDQLSAHASGRVEEREEKRSPHDFALWILGKEQSMMWESPWGKGYPGWHIECSAMAEKYLGSQIDLHMGGMDNKFPHHECEIAQTEGASGKHPFVKTWLHAALITVDGQKMSKSKGNVYFLKDVEEKGFSLRAYRFLCVSTHYRSSMDFSWHALEQAKTTLQSIDRFVERLREVEKDGNVSMEFSQFINAALVQMMDSIQDDLNTPEYLANFFECMRQLNTMLDENNLNSAEAAAMISFIETIDTPLTVLLPWKEEHHEIPDEVLRLVELRKQARIDKDFARSDEFRDEIQKLGYIVEDKVQGMRVRKI